MDDASGSFPREPFPLTGQPPESPTANVGLTLAKDPFKPCQHEIGGRGGGLSTKVGVLSGRYNWCKISCIVHEINPIPPSSFASLPQKNVPFPALLAYGV